MTIRISTPNRRASRPVPKDEVAPERTDRFEREAGGSYPAVAVGAMPAGLSVELNRRQLTDGKGRRIILVFRPKAPKQATLRDDMGERRADVDVATPDGFRTAFRFVLSGLVLRASEEQRARLSDGERMFARSVLGALLERLVAPANDVAQVARDAVTDLERTGGQPDEAEASPEQLEERLARLGDVGLTEEARSALGRTLTRQLRDQLIQERDRIVSRIAQRRKQIEESYSDGPDFGAVRARIATLADRVRTLEAREQLGLTDAEQAEFEAKKSQLNQEIREHKELVLRDRRHRGAIRREVVEPEVREATKDDQAAVDKVRAEIEALGPEPEAPKTPPEDPTPPTDAAPEPKPTESAERRRRRREATEELQVRRRDSTAALRTYGNDLVKHLLQRLRRRETVFRPDETITRPYLGPLDLPGGFIVFDGRAKKPYDRSAIIEELVDVLGASRAKRALVERIGGHNFERLLTPEERGIFDAGTTGLIDRVGEAADAEEERIRDGGRDDEMKRRDEEAEAMERSFPKGPMVTEWAPERWAKEMEEELAKADRMKAAGLLPAAQNLALGAS